MAQAKFWTVRDFRICFEEAKCARSDCYQCSTACTRLDDIRRTLYANCCMMICAREHETWSCQEAVTARVRGFSKSLPLRCVRRIPDCPRWLPWVQKRH
eukprot:scaffold380_cov272-Pinguiococcus_pyrenoidosus.AAC.7